MLLSIALATKTEKECSVIDFGGACGALYFFAKTFFKSIKLNWYVIETPAMVRKAKALENDELKFCDRLESVQNSFSKIDILFSSGTLQAIQDPYKLLNELIDINAKYLLLSRLGLSKEDHDIVTVHELYLSANGPGPLPHGIRDKLWKIPTQFISKNKLDTTIQKKYNILLQIDDETGVFKFKKYPIIGLSYLAERKEN